ncbi:uncharacterized protein LOC131008406 [Salvia miltiorrhiza]|uniref:uncharacterized protein LOC131008406 n=1 Tax=Salvia miltiorrhiza TaxID=226208 RepID=UPI0025AD503D|nr:uncharacterized protein LOC131008406 [Salvia miltiorrhiza]
MNNQVFLSTALLLLIIFKFCIAADTLSPNQTLSDGELLISPSRRFELGFISPGSSTARFLGIRYTATPNVVVWVANRERPITGDSPGVLALAKNGTLVLTTAQRLHIWSSSSSMAASTPVLQLLDSGNLVVVDEAMAPSSRPESYMWQSFDHPGDTWLPGMKMVQYLDTGEENFLTSWRSADDPSIGEFSYKIENSGLSQVLIKKGMQRVYRAIFWDGRFPGFPLLPYQEWKTGEWKTGVETNNGKLVSISQPFKESINTRLIMNYSGSTQRYVMNEENDGWILMISGPRDLCDNYGLCGANGICKINKTPVCECLRGFKPKSDEEWGNFNWSSGCTRNLTLDCQVEDGFLKVEGLKIPDSLSFQLETRMSIGECHDECLKNCTCSAYGDPYFKNETSCLMWFGDLIDTREQTVEPGGGPNIYIRVPVSETELEPDWEKRRKGLAKMKIIYVAAASSFGMLILGLFLKMRCKREASRKTRELSELPLFDLAAIAAATNNFSKENMIGEGGFGPVYKGILSAEQVIAVKRMSKNSGQGPEEFKNELILIAKLQHRNLVRILGCCIEGEEKMLIYEYMQNKSLDYFIFDQERRPLLTWPKRFDIIMGIARGMVYLHNDSRVKIIHRDLKASNILLDENLNAKISDFGLARMFEGDQSTARTKRVAGTYGYMAPEYAFDGKFSVKSDIFSFGVVILEIVSGKKNTGFKHPSCYQNLLEQAWLLWQENRELEMMDTSYKSSYTEPQVKRCIQIGLLCVQNAADERPMMPSVVLMLSSEDTALPRPKKPGFFLQSRSSFLKRNDKLSSGTITMSDVEARYRYFQSLLYNEQLGVEHQSTLPHQMEHPQLTQILCLLSIFKLCIAADTLFPNQTLPDGELLISPAKIFELGFFSPGKNTGRFLGIWYKNTPDIVVWVANRESPITGQHGYLTITNNGSLILTSPQGTTPIWISSSSMAASTPVVQLLDSGNLLIVDKLIPNSFSQASYIWQSFDYPGDTRLPGMKMVVGDTHTGDQAKYLTSWRTVDDPSVGEFSYRIENHGLSQLMLTKGAQRVYRTIFWGGHFPEFPNSPNQDWKTEFSSQGGRLVSVSNPFSDSAIIRVTMNYSGVLEGYIMNDQKDHWNLMIASTDDLCNSYGRCGHYGICKINKMPVCECLRGFKPRSEKEWRMYEWRNGCYRDPPLDCQKGDDFLKMEGIKFPDSLNFQLNANMSSVECRRKCLSECNCTAYADDPYSDYERNCLMWFGDLIDLRELSTESGAVPTVYIRVPVTELEHATDSNRKRTGQAKRELKLIGAAASGFGMLILGFAIGGFFLQIRHRRQASKKVRGGLELPLFDLGTIATATNNFSTENMIGEGGFGPVYKGILSAEQVIAVKRMSRSSGQGPEEFRNEFILIAKLQHRNLVKILGCCIEGEEKMLIYEYMQNKSLDYFIFDQERRPLLTWPKRFDIIMGIARGMVYLHNDSRVKIIHRDLKTSNILLDENLNAKISDFGLARMIEGDQTTARTKRVVGTYGYMAPEYAFDGKFSFKSDIFSFGVVILEIVSGKRNRGFKHPCCYQNLLEQAWLLWQENRELEMIDPSYKNPCVEPQVKRCIQIGLLCAQNAADERPMMPSVVLMLSSEDIVLPQPKKPGFFLQSRSSFLRSASRSENSSFATITMSDVEAR